MQLGRLKKTVLHNPKPKQDIYKLYALHLGDMEFTVNYCSIGDAMLLLGFCLTPARGYRCGLRKLQGEELQQYLQEYFYIHSGEGI